MDDSLKVLYVSHSENYKIMLERIHNLHIISPLNFRFTRGNLLFVMILLIWGGQHWVTSAFVRENLWVAHTIRTL